MKNQVDSIFNPQGLKSTGRRTRQVKLDPVKANNAYIERRLIKETETSNGRCDKGTRWVQKLRTCVDSEAFRILKQQNKAQARVKENTSPDSREILREALRNYDSYRKQPQERL